MRMYLLCAFLLGALSINAQSARLQGKVLDENLGGEPVSFANIVLLKDDEQVAGTSSDLDGNYNFSNIEPGTYSILISYVGLPDLKIINLSLLEEKASVRDFKFPKTEGSKMSLETIIIEDTTSVLEIKDAKKPTPEEIKTLGTRNIGNIQVIGCHRGAISYTFQSNIIKRKMRAWWQAFNPDNKF